MRVNLGTYLLSLTLCACSQAQLGLSPESRPADAAVYRAVLDSIANSQSARRPTQLVVIDSTLTADPGLTELEKVPEAESTAISEFKKRNSDSHSLAYLSSLDTQIPIVLVSRHTLESFLHDSPEAYWAEFYRRYPGSHGSIAFSSVGYNAKGDVALLELETACGTLCGALSNVVVKRVAGRWRVTLIEVKIVS